jgi:hypothetical protein
MVETTEKTTRLGARSTAREVVAGHDANVVFAVGLTQRLAVSEELIVPGGSETSG